MILGDAGRLRELIDNLLDNAIRYSRNDGRVTVRVSALPAPAMIVSDDGPSIPPHERERVFGELRRHFQPEFLNRVDDIVLFIQHESRTVR